MLKYLYKRMDHIQYLSSTPLTGLHSWHLIINHIYTKYTSLSQMNTFLYTWDYGLCCSIHTVTVKIVLIHDMYVTFTTFIDIYYSLHSSICHLCPAVYMCTSWEKAGLVREWFLSLCVLSVKPLNNGVLFINGEHKQLFAIYNMPVCASSTRGETRLHLNHSNCLLFCC